MAITDRRRHVHGGGDDTNIRRLRFSVIASLVLLLWQWMRASPENVGPVLPATNFSPSQNGADASPRTDRRPDTMRGAPDKPLPTSAQLSDEPPSAGGGAKARRAQQTAGADDLWAWTPTECDPHSVTGLSAKWDECIAPSTSCGSNCAYYAAGSFVEGSRDARVNQTRALQRRGATETLAEAALALGLQRLCSEQDVRWLLVIDGAAAEVQRTDPDERVRRQAQRKREAAVRFEEFRARLRGHLERAGTAAEASEEREESLQAAKAVIRESLAPAWHRRENAEVSGDGLHDDVVSDNDPHAVLAPKFALQLSRISDVDVVMLLGGPERQDAVGMAISMKRDRGGGTNCRVPPVTAESIISAVHVAFARRTVAGAPGPVPVIHFAGDSPLRQLAMSLVATLRGQRFQLDRMTHGGFRYTLTADGDLIQLSPDASIPPRPTAVAGHPVSAREIILEVTFVYVKFPTPEGRALPDNVFRPSKGGRPWALVVGLSYQLLGDKGVDAVAAGQALPKLPVQHAVAGDADGGGAAEARQRPERDGAAPRDAEVQDERSELRARAYLAVYGRYLENLQSDLNALLPGMVRTVVMAAINSGLRPDEAAEIGWVNDHVRAVVAASRLQWAHRHGGAPFPVRILELNALSRALEGRIARRDRLHFACSIYGRVPHPVEGIHRNTGSGCTGWFERAAATLLLHGFLDPGPSA